MGVLDAESGGSVGTLVAIDTGVSLHPGELKQGVVVAQQAKEILEQGAKGPRSGELEKGEIGPTIAFHGKEAASNKAENECRVNVDM